MSFSYRTCLDLIAKTLNIDSHSNVEEFNALLQSIETHCNEITDAALKKGQVCDRIERIAKITYNHAFKCTDAIQALSLDRTGHKRHVKTLTRRLLELKNEDGNVVEMSTERELERWTAATQLYHANEVLERLVKRINGLMRKLYVLQKRNDKLQQEHLEVYQAWKEVNEEDVDLRERTRMLEDTLRNGLAIESVAGRRKC